jgi:hypothetical protein
MAKRIHKNHKIFVSFFIFWKKKLANLGNFAEKLKIKNKSCLVPMSEGSGHPALTHHSSCLVSQKEQPQGPRNSPRTFLPARQNLGSFLSLSGGSSLDEAAVCVFRAFASLACRVWCSSVSHRSLEPACTATEEDENLIHAGWFASIWTSGSRYLRLVHQPFLFFNFFGGLCSISFSIC